MAQSVEPQADTQARLEELARSQGVAPVVDTDQLEARFWPADESADDFLAAVRAWRRGEEPPTA